MIILTRLQVHNYKSLREIDLTFPKQGSILVEGNNETGKSTLFESVYFALYGQPLEAEDVNTRGRKRHDTAIAYGQYNATVSLTLDVSGTTLQVTRKLDSKRPSSARLQITSPDGTFEEVADIRAVNSRIVQELGNLDRESLLNSCFVEQKKLSKLEDLDAAQRRESLVHLLNLDKLRSLEAEFKPRLEDRDAVNKAVERLRLAQAQARVPAVERKLAETRSLKAAAEMHATFAQIGEQEERLGDLQRQKVEIEVELQGLQRLLDKVEELKSRREGLRTLRGQLEELERWQAQASEISAQLQALEERERQVLPRLQSRRVALQAVDAAFKRLSALGEELTTSEAEIQRCQRQIEEIEQRAAASTLLAEQIAAQETRLDEQTANVSAAQETASSGLKALAGKREALRALEKMLSAHEVLLREYRTAQQQAEEYARLEESILSARGALAARQADVAAAEAPYEQATMAHEEARRAARLTDEASALDIWLRAQRAMSAETHFDAQMVQAAAVEREAQARLESAAKQVASTQRRFFVLVGAGVVGLAAGALLMTLNLTVLGVIIAVVGLVLLAFVVTTRGGGAQQQTALIEATSTLDQARQVRIRVEAERSASEALGGGRAQLAEAETRLRGAGASVPTVTLEAEQRVTQIRRQDASLAERDPATLQTELEQARAALEEAHRRERDAATRLQLLQERAEQHPAAPQVVDGGDDNAVALLVARGESFHDLEPRLSQSEAQFRSEAEHLRVEPQIVAVQQALTALEQQESTLSAELAKARDEQQGIARELGALQADKKRLEGEQRWLAQQEPAALGAELESATRRVAGLRIRFDEQEADLRSKATALEIVPSEAAAQQAQGAVEAQIEQLQADLQKRPDLVRRREALTARCEKATSATVRLWRSLLPLPGAPDSSTSDIGEEHHLLTLAGLAQAEESTAAALAALDESGARTRQAALTREEGNLASDERGAISQIRQLGARVVQLLDRQGLSLGEDPDAQAVAKAFPQFKEVGAGDVDRLAGEEHETLVDLQTAVRERDELASRLSLRGVELDVTECEEELALRQRELAVKERASAIAKSVASRMIDKVLPKTARNMSLLLPMLTLDRYRDCQITADYKLQIWDEQAGRYVAKNIFSGGTRDQFSLALRLAFALAALPEELGTTPGFIFLDEPLSSFDRPRTEALVNLLTRGHISTYFRQIFVISHSSVFDRGLFTHHLVMENGSVSEHDFDKVPATSVNAS